TPVIQSISSLDGRYRAVNESFIEITGYSRDEALGKTSLELRLWPRSEDREEALRRFEKEGRLRNLEVLVRTKSGAGRLILWALEKIELENQTYLLATGVDITERKQAETDLRLSEERLRALSAKVHSAREEEGARIAREIHDELGSALTGLKW